MISAFDLAFENLKSTYLSLSHTIDDAVISNGEGYVLAESQSGKPMANYALCHTISPWTARELAEIASSRIRFQIYFVSQTIDQTSLEILARAGFAVSGKLSILIGRPTDTQPSEHPPRNASGGLEIARFLANLFYPRQTERFRAEAAESLAEAQGGELRAYGQELLAGVMLRPESSVTGIYNLGVKPSARNRGLGTKILQRLCAETEKPFTLQCEQSLISWYSRQGFESIGHIHTLNLCQW